MRMNDSENENAWKDAFLVLYTQTERQLRF